MSRKSMVANDGSVLDIKELFEKDIEMYSVNIKESLYGDLPELNVKFKTDDDTICKVNDRLTCSLKSGEGAEWKFNAFIYDQKYINNIMEIKTICWDQKFTKDKFTTKYTSIKNAIESTCFSEIIGNPDSATKSDIMDFKDPFYLYQRNETNYHFCTRLCKSYKYNTVFGYVLDGLIFVDLSSWKKDIELKDRSDISLVTPSTWTESKLFEEKVEYIDYSNGKDPNHVIVKFYEDMIPVNKEYKELVGNGLFNRKLYNSKNVNTFQMKYIPQFRVGQFAKIPSEQIRFNECFISERVVDFDKANVSVSFTIQSINP
jgi:hypothetical protein